ncbi:MAG TPA: tetratricopeptide repeat protein [Rhodanobacteraceae bacterium]|nr:tetratricopeptide repeat protein [Rhodanobacteraceae bacterium]
MARLRPLLAELQHRNVLRASVLYVGAVWALSQGVAQLSPALGLPDEATRWFLISCTVGFPLWVAFAWLYEFTPKGFRRDRDVAPDAPLRHSNARRLDFAIIAVLAVAVVLLGTSHLVGQRPQAAGEAATAVPPRSIAVLPFENLSGDPANEYFVAGIQDLILTKLANFGSLKVVSRSSTARYKSRPADLKAIGRQLGVATVLEGSVQKQGDEVLINVQLIDARSDSHLWAESYQRTLDSVFGVEGDVAEKIAAALRARLSPAESAHLATRMSADPVANNLFLRAQYLADQSKVNYDTASMRAAMPLYREAIERDPGFALAHAQFSLVASRLAWFGGGGMQATTLVADARQHAEQALKLAPNLSAAQLALGYCDYYGRGDYDAALKAFAAALALRPNDAEALAAHGYIERRQGRLDAASASLQRAFALDPRNSQLAYEVGLTEKLAGRYPDAERWLHEALALDPENRLAAIQVSNTIVAASGDFLRALAAAQGDDPSLQQQRVHLLTLQRRYRDALALLASIPDSTDNFKPGSAYSLKALWLAELYRLLGDDVRARPLFAQVLPQVRAQLAQREGISRMFVWQDVATAELGLGHTAQGLAAIAAAQAIAEQSGDRLYGPEAAAFHAMLYAEARRPDLALPLLAGVITTPGKGGPYAPVLLWLDPAWDPIRSDPGFQALLKENAKYRPAVIPAAAVVPAEAGTQ